MKKTLLTLTCVFIYLLSVTAQETDSTEVVKEKENINHNWFNKSPIADEIYGAEVEKTYDELLEGKNPVKVIVAVIDAGIDYTHEDLKDQIWVNTNEIPENGIDDDNNGYIDDIHGWNFLGNKEGEMISLENLETTRIYKKYNNYSGELNDAEKDLYKQAKKLYEKDYKNSSRQKKMFDNYKNKYFTSYKTISAALNNAEITIEKLDSLKENNKKLKKEIKFLYRFVKFGVDSTFFDDIDDMISEKLDYHLNLDFNPREIIGDDQSEIETPYGNNNIYGPEAGHGTAVSGIIAATRNNDTGINGVTNNLQIMGLKVVPNGDERDKDIAKAVRYAADNGAQIINMSFGKRLSPYKNLVDEAFLYAEEKGVLIVHASGNDGYNIDKIKQYPTKNTLDGKQISTWITVGASSMMFNESFAANFTNYGVTMVDIFAPGVNIYTLEPENEYSSGSGTSFAAPVVSGVAALVLSYYPELTAIELKDILLKSSVKYPNKEVNKPGDYSKKPKKVLFSELSNTAGLINAYQAIKMADKMNK